MSKEDLKNTFQNSIGKIKTLKARNRKGPAEEQAQVEAIQQAQALQSEQVQPEQPVKATKTKKAKKKSSITWGAIFRRINEIVMDRVAVVVTGIDKVLDLTAWGLERTAVLALRKIHGFREGLNEHAGIIKKIALFGVVAAVAIISIFMGAIDYAYSYHGRTLGIVKEQSDVLQVLDLVSDGLSKEYGSTITIDPDKDITFKPVISAGKEIDKPDTVLQKFTYMGDLPTTAYAIMIDDVQAATVQSEDAGNWVIDTIIDRYIVGKREDYELVELSAPVEIVEKTVKLSSIQNQRDALKVIDDGITKTYTYTARQGDTPEIAAKELGITVEELLQ